MAGIYDKIIKREEDGPDPLVPEPSGTGQVKKPGLPRKGVKRTLNFTSHLRGRKRGGQR